MRQCCGPASSTMRQKPQARMQSCSRSRSSSSCMTIRPLLLGRPRPAPLPCGVLASTTHQQQQHARRRGAGIAAAATNSSSSSSGGSSASSFSERAQAFADSTQQAMQDFVKQQRLEQRAAEASKAAQDKLRELGQETQQNVRRTYMKLESEHNISSRLRGASTRLTEAARDLDQELSLRRRLRGAMEDAQRLLPQWRRQAAAFAATPLGKVSLTMLFVGLLFSGLLWQLLNAVWLLWWLSIPVSLLLASQRSKAAAEAAAAQAQAQQEASRNPFVRWRSGGSGSGGGSSSNGGARGRGYSNAYGDGPIVEAEWESLDEADEGGSRRRGR